MKRLLFLSWLCFSAVGAKADTIAVENPSFFEKLYEVVKDFSRIDTNYIEPQHYNYTVMLQNTNTYESYTLRNKEGQELVLSPEPSIKIGPYVGWRWLVLGYTIDISHLFDKNRNQDWDISLYSNQIGVDLFYRKTGNNYRVRLSKLGKNIENQIFKDINFSGFKASVKGFNLYYILNHKKFSYPAAFNQSTCQKVSYGSPLIGIGYTKHTLDLDASKLGDLVEQYTTLLGVGKINLEDLLDLPKSVAVNYTDVSVSGGYAYNWVFAKNWLAAASLSLAVGYKHTTGDLEHENSWLRDFSFRNFNFDGVGRFGIVWNNTRWYAGSSVIFHSYNYRKSQFSTNSLFGNLNIYAGYNFGNRHRTHKKK